MTIINNSEYQQDIHKHFKVLGFFGFFLEDIIPQLFFWLEILSFHPSKDPQIIQNKANCKICSDHLQLKKTCIPKES